MSFKRSTFSNLLFCVLLSTTSACSLNINTSDNNDASAGFQPAAITRAQQANLYVYRPTTMTNGLYSTEISVDDEHIFMVKLGHLKHLKVPAGQHQIKLDTDSNIIDQQQLDVVMEAGKSYYFSITTSLKIDSGANFKPYKRQFDLQPVESTIAIKQITDCCYSDKVAQKAPEPDTLIKKDTAIEENDATFSVDKTSNPFSH